MMNLFDHLTTTGDFEAFIYPNTTDGTLSIIAEQLTGAIFKRTMIAKMGNYQLVNIT